jgi:C4-dicarboxylate-specific signal transduction histidine kinase
MALSNFAVATRAMVGHAPTDMLIPALDDIVQQSKRASEIVRRVRAFINPQRANYEQLNINDVISHAIGMLQSELQRNTMDVQMTLTPALPLVRGDKVLLEQVVVNLIQNAIHAQLDKPTMTRRIDIHTILQDGAVQVSIADYGTGIPADKMANLFTPFFTTKSEGLGLGLNICRTIVEAHGGHIAVSNKPTGGAIFTITLPTAP